MYANLKKKTAKLSVISNSLLIILKLSVGIITNSVSIISEAIHSSIDLVAAIIAFFSVRISGTPADKEHPFGHGKIENVSGVIEAILIFIASDSKRLELNDSKIGLLRVSNCLKA